jgi:hypothetical protein
MVGGMAIFAFLGYWIDQKRGEVGIFTLAGMLLGVGYCFYEAWKFIRRKDKKSIK